MTARREPHPAVTNVDFSWRDVWPRRPRADLELPPGQRLIRAFPRFADDPRPPPPTVGAIGIRVGGAVRRPTTFDGRDLEDLTRVERTADFHCVTTWSVPGVRWGGWSLSELWHRLVAPTTDIDPRARWIVAVGADGFRARVHLDDALGTGLDDGAIVADTLEGAPLDVLHGAPLRLVSPTQYGYKSVKHLVEIVVHVDEPAGAIGPKEHPRARVAHEERHARYPARLLRWPYRLVVPPTAMIARRSARRTATRT